MAQNYQKGEILIDVAAQQNTAFDSEIYDEPSITSSSTYMSFNEEYIYEDGMSDHAQEVHVYEICIRAEEPSKKNVPAGFEKCQDTNVMHDAVLTQDVKRVELLCDKLIVTNASGKSDRWLMSRDRSGRTAFHYCITSTMAKTILSYAFTSNHKKLVCAQDIKGMTVAHYAAMLGCTDLLEYLFSLNLDDCKSGDYEPVGASECILKPDLKGRTPLHYALKVETVQIILENADSMCLSLVDEDGQNAAEFAEHANREEVAKCLKVMYVLNTCGEDITFIHYAVKTDNFLLVEYLVGVCSKQTFPGYQFLVKEGEYSVAKWGIGSLVQIDHLGRSVFHYVKSFDVAQILAEAIELAELYKLFHLLDHSGSSIFHRVAMNDELVDVLQYFCALMMQMPGSEQASEVECEQLSLISIENMVELLKGKDITGKTALHIASDNGNVDVFQMLCSVASLNEDLLFQQDQAGNTVLHLAKNRQIVETTLNIFGKFITETLLKAVNFQKSTLLHLVAEDGRTDILQCLLENDLLSKELIFQKNNKGQTVWHCACHAESVDVLISATTAISDRSIIFSEDDLGRTLLHYAANADFAHKITQCVSENTLQSVLLAIDKNDQTAMHFAIMNNRYDVAIYLCSLRMNKFLLMSKQDAAGKTALHYISNSSDITIDFLQILSEQVNAIFPISSARQAANFSLNMQIPTKADDECFANPHLLQTEDDGLAAVQTNLFKKLILLPDKNKITALHSVISQNLESVTAFFCTCLSECKACWGLEDASGLTVLDYAIKCENQSILISVLNAISADCTELAWFHSAKSLFFDAVGKDQFHLVEQICSSKTYRSFLNLKNSQGRLPIHLAESKQMTQIILSANNPANKIEYLSQALDSFGATALHLASAMGRTEVVAYICSLISNSSQDVQFLLQLDVYNKAALCYATNSHIIYLLSEQFSAFKNLDISSLHEAAKMGRCDVVHVFTNIPTSYKKLLFCQDDKGQTPLHHAENGEVTEAILDSMQAFAPEWVLISDNKMRTALHTAIIHSREGVVQVLTNRFPVTQSELLLKTDIFNKSVMHYTNANRKVAECILNATDFKFDIAEEQDAEQIKVTSYHVCSNLLVAKDKYGKTPLHYCEEASVIKLFIKYAKENFSQVNTLFCMLDNQERTPLHIFAKANLFELVRHVCQYVSDDLPENPAYIFDKCNQLPIDYALENCNLQVINTLLQMSKLYYYIWPTKFTNTSLLIQVIHKAATENDVLLLHNLCESFKGLGKFKPISSKNDLGKSILHKANTLPTVRIIVEAAEKELFTFKTDKEGNSVVHDMATGGRTAILQFLLSITQFKMQLFIYNEYGKSPLHVALNAETAKILVDAANAIDFQYKNDNTNSSALHDASEQGRVEVLEYLLRTKYGANHFNEPNEFGESLLHIACNERAARAIISSIKEGEVMNYLKNKDILGQTALHLASQDDRFDVARYICNMYLSDDSLFLQKDNKMRTALHYATNKDMVQILTNAVSTENLSFFIFEQDVYQMSALHTTLVNGKDDAARSLCDCNVSVTELLASRDKYGRNALFYVKQESTMHFFLKQLEFGESRKLLTMQDNNQETALHFIVRTDKMRLVEYFLGRMSDDFQPPAQLHNFFDDLELCCHNGATILHLAVNLDHHDLLSLILSKIPSSNIKFFLQRDSQGRTALHNASTADVAIQLLSAIETKYRRKFLTAGDADGNTALHLAVQKDNLDLVETFCSLIHVKTINDITGFMAPCNCNNLSYEAISIDESDNICLYQNANIGLYTDFQRDISTSGQTFSDIQPRKPSRTKVCENCCMTNFSLAFIKGKSRKTPLHEARSKVVAECLVNSIDKHHVENYLSATDDRNQTVLHIAAGQNRHEVVKYICNILTSDALLFKRDIYDKVPLNYAQNDQVVKVLLNNFEPIQNQIVLDEGNDETKLSTFHRALKEGKTNIVRIFLEIPWADQIISQNDEKGRSVFHYAYNKEILLMLIAKGQSDMMMKADTEHGQTPLHAAVIHDHTDVVRCLLDNIEEQYKGSFSSLKDKNGRTALHYAQTRHASALLLNAATDAVELLSETEEINHQTALHMASKGGFSDVVEHMVNNFSYTDIAEKTDKYGRIPLHYAANTSVAKYLIRYSKHGISSIINFADTSKNHTPLHTAALNSNTDVLKYYLDCLPDEAFIETLDNNGRTALHLVRDVEAAKHLLAKIEAPKQEKVLRLVDTNQRNILHHACLQNSKELILFYLSCDISLEALLWHKDTSNKLPFHYAKDLGVISCIISIIPQEDKADYILSGVEKNEFDMVMAAAIQERFDVVEFLLNNLLSAHENALIKTTTNLLKFAEANYFNEDKDEIYPTVMIRPHLSDFLYVNLMSKESLLFERVRGSIKLTYINNSLLASYILRTSENKTVNVDLALAGVKKVNRRNLSALTFKLANAKVLNQTLKMRHKPLLHLLADASKMSLKNSVVLTSSSDDKKSFFHQAIEKQINLVDRILIETVDYHLLLSKPDQNGKVPLHYVGNVQLAKTLLNTIDINSRANYLQMYTRDVHMNSLHIASRNGCHEMVSYIITALPYDSLFDKDINGMTALHHASTSAVCREILNAISNESEKDKILQEINNDGQTVLHIAARQGKVELVQEIFDQCDDWKSISTFCDEKGRTALHYATDPQIIEIILGNFQEENCSILLQRDSFGKTALHYSNNGDIARSLINLAEDPMELLTIEDKNGFTGLTHAIKHGNLSLFEDMLDCIEDLPYDGDILANLAKMKNCYKQNIYHLACLSPFMDQILEAIICRIVPQVSDLTSPDIYRNTPISYAVSKFNAKVFSNFMLSLPLPLRKKAIDQKNIKNVSCRTILSTQMFSTQYYTTSVLCSPAAVDQIYGGTYFEMDREYKMEADGFFSCNLDFRVQFSTDILKVLHYALNQYSLLEPMFVLSQALVTSLLSRSLLIDSHSMIWLNYDCDYGERDQKKIQQQINLMNDPRFHGQPKVIVLQSTEDSQIYLTPPAPDYLIVSPIYKSVEKRPLQISEDPVDSIDGLFMALRGDGNVKRIEISSTLGRRYHDSSLEETTTSLDNANGRALVVCNLQGREGGEAELDYAKLSLGLQLGLQVEEACDLSTAEEMIRTIKVFSESLNHGSIVALAIMSHGDTNSGGIYGNDGSVFTVQEVVDALCSSNLKHIPKMLWLSFCRGKLGRGRSNRTHAAWTSSTPFIEWPSEINPVRRELNQESFAAEWQRHPFPAVKIPEDCYIFYSTLPDSLSPRKSIVFKCLSRYLRDTFVASHSVIFSSPNRAGRALDENDNAITINKSCNDTHLMHEEVMFASAKFPNVELIDLVTDVAGLVREGSQCTQYMHHCYTVSPNTKPVVLQVYPPTPETSV
ncbi:hypothetical protein EB796_001182 [Bugula neritina]|uniref:Caspase family p20 domain-containing protein n=1 Tax=Bugula neritina TaxID=10212 RepID=A0A7J7KQY1_BUGNE|nr:hypothetical protein EB796_001182 [Bugula neritina]